MEDLRERQKNELIVLESIYLSNFIDLTENGVSKKKQPNTPYFKITLLPVNSQSQHGAEQAHVQIDLKIKFSPEYPNEPPNITLENEKGLSVDQVRTLKKQLVDKAQKLKGGEMIYELCQDVQDYLYLNNKPPSKSFYEQRLELEEVKLKESLLVLEHSKIDHQLIAEIDQAVDQKKKMLQLERKKEKELEKKERLLSNSSPPRNRLSKNDFENEIRESAEIMVAHKQSPQHSSTLNFQPFTIDFKLLNKTDLKIKCFKQIRNDFENSMTVYRGIDLNNNEIYTIYEWKIRVEKNRIYEQTKLDTCLTEIHKIEDELKNLNRLNNKTLVKYLACNYFKEPDKNIFTIQFCLEYIEGNTLEMFLCKKKPNNITESTLKTITLQLIDALDCLHSNNLVHRELKPSCVYIDNTLDIRLSDSSIVKKLNNLNALVSNDAANIVTGNIKSDIHQLGILVLSLHLGESVQYYPQVPSSLPPELKNFVNSCINKPDRVDCKFLRTHPFILKTSDPGVNQSSSLLKRTSSIHYEDDEFGLGSFTDYSNHSRLNTEFEVIGLIGKGAYGEVLKVKNKLDSRFYAIKRIRINLGSEEFEKSINREIKLLSRLNHENVVRYYSTWVEDEVKGDKKKSQNERFMSIVEDTNEDNSSFSDDEEDDDSDSNPGRIAWSKTRESSTIDSGTDFDSEMDSISSSVSSDESTGQNKFFKNKAVNFTLNNKDESDESVVFAENSAEKVPKIPKKKEPIDSKPKEKTENQSITNGYIYIQMEFCGNKTLKDLIDDGLYKNMDKVWTLFREILQGLKHIHERKIIHRDLKPSNVLIDRSGHAKIGDFGLAKITAPNNAMYEIAFEDNMAFNSLTLSANNPGDSLQMDSLSGAVGTALYVAPELMTPFSKNKYVYTQKVDIYSLGIMFYEMCYPFSTNMERIHVIQNLRLKDTDIKSHKNDKNDTNQICLIRLMLNHDPAARPSAKELLLNDMVPRKQDEIVLDELLEYSFQNKQSSYYKKILNSIFEQKGTRIDDASFDVNNCKPPSSIRDLQIRDHLHNQFVRIFQKHGGYMITYPLLTPCTEFFDVYNKAFKLTDACGLVLCLPYNHRVPFARYLARSSLTNIKRYQIGKVFSEKLKMTSLHPREYTEASFDIVTSSPSDCLPEIEILSVMGDVINSFPEMAEQNYALVINHSYLLNAILHYCGISEEDQKNIYYLLAEYNKSAKTAKSHNATSDNRMNWFQHRLPHLNLKHSSDEKLLNFLLKTGEPEKILSELRSLTKGESKHSKLAKEALNQLKLILTNIQILDLKIPVVLSPAFVLPVVSHPFEYSGFIFELLVKRKNNKNEFDILASGGRYDSMISKFRNRPSVSQCAVGISFDFEKIAFIISEKTRQNSFRSELVVCSVGDSLANNQSSMVQSTSLSSFSSLTRSKRQIQKLEAPAVSNNSLIIQESRNRLRLYKQLMLLNKNMNISTHMIHDKFSSTDEMDEYCKSNFINCYAYINDNSILFTSKLFSNNETHDGGSMNDENSSTSSSNNQSFLSIRSWIDRGYKFLEKKFNLSEFLTQSNQLISFNSNHSTSSSMNSPMTNSLLGSFSLSSLPQTPTNQSYIDFVNSLVTPQNLSFNCPTISNFSSSPATTSSLVNNSTSSTTLNTMSQLNVTILLEPSNRQQTSGSVNRKKLESQIISKLSQTFSIFNSKTRIELIIIETTDNVIQALANNLHLEQSAANFKTNWTKCMEVINNVKYKRQLSNYNLEDILYDLRYVRRSKVFVLYGYKSDQFKLIVAA